jgi:hypothetical protein
VFARALRMAVITALAAVMIAIGAPAAQAQTVTADTYYVDAVSGINLPGRGSQAEPFNTFTYAVSQSDALDTIMVQPGVADDLQLRGGGVPHQSGQQHPAALSLLQPR